MNIYFASYPKRILSQLIDISIEVLFIKLVSFLLCNTILFPDIYISIPIVIVYHVFPMWRFHKTFGMFLLNVEFLSANGSELSLKRCFLHYLMSQISAFCVYIGFLWMFFDKHRQTWHDKVVGVFVVSSADIKNNGKDIFFESLKKTGKMLEIFGIVSAIISSLVVFCVCVLVHLAKYKITAFSQNTFRWNLILFIILPYLYSLLFYRVGKEMIKNDLL
jgi:uncharacterized RDD family membrane protein YckC